MRSWQGEKVRVLGVQGLYQVSRSKLQVSPLTQRLHGFRGQEDKIPTKTTEKKLGTNVLRLIRKSEVTLCVYSAPG